MKKSIIIKAILILILFSSGICFSKENRYDHEVEFGDSKGNRIIQFSGNGDLNVTGYEGNKVLVSSNKNIFEENNEVNEKAKGLRKIAGGGFNIINNKKENIIIISRPVDKHIDLDIKVPNNITLKFGSDVNRQSWGNGNFAAQIVAGIVGGNKKGPQNNPISVIVNNTVGGVFNGIIEGDVNVKNFSGIIEVNTVHGSINAENIDGEVIASTVEGDINITFNRLNKDRALYFSTVNGDIDITFPKGINADIMTRTMEGDVYSGFDGDVTLGKETEDETASTESQNNFSNIFQPNYITTRINGGGQNIYLSTIDGNVYIRKGE
jgi:hypothetical protein